MMRGRRQGTGPSLFTRLPAAGAPVFDFGDGKLQRSERVVDEAPQAKVLIPFDQPNPARVGLIRMQPFEHYCAVCGRYAAFGFGCDFIKREPGTWYCGEHRIEGERRWAALGRV
jgi:hypothetical protein